jgi:hypothetical protein
MNHLDRNHERGFSLLEVGLALSVGIMILGASIYGYRALREQAGDAGMRQKVQDLQLLVEELYVGPRIYPTGTELANAWKHRRPKDYQSSPWGGFILATEANRTNSGGIKYSVIPENLKLTSGQDDDLPGGMYYTVIENGAGGYGRAEFGDLTRAGALVSANSYAIAGNKIIGNNGFRYFYVLSGPQ